MAISCTFNEKREVTASLQSTTVSHPASLKHIISNGDEFTLNVQLLRLSSWWQGGRPWPPHTQEEGTRCQPFTSPRSGRLWSAQTNKRKRASSIEPGGSGELRGPIVIRREWEAAL